MERKGRSVKPSSSTPYGELDAAIVKAIQAGKVRFIEIWTAVESLALPFAKHRDPDRVVDRRLQALRKRRLITFWSGKWRIGNDR